MLIYRLKDNIAYALDERGQERLLINDGRVEETGVYQLSLEGDLILQAKKLDISDEEYIERLIAQWRPKYPMPKEMEEELRKVGKRLWVRKYRGYFFVVRCHNDADGISGCYGISKVTSAYRSINNSPFYTLKEASYDLSVLLNKQRPFLVLVDFGGNESSEEALRVIEKAHIEYQVIDHHPYQTSNPNIFNSWKYDNTGQYTAGYIACEIARMLNRDVESMINVGLAGDKSNIAPLSEEDKEKALVVDYLTTYSNDVNFMLKVLENPELYQEFKTQAKQKIEEIHDLLGELEYTPINGIKLFMLNVDDIVKRTEFQSSGKIASFLLEREGPDAVVIAQTRNIFVMRVGEGAYKKGVNTKKILDYFKDIGSGGGHEKAGAMRVPPKYMGYVRGEIPRLIKRMVEGAL